MKKIILGALLTTAVCFGLIGGTQNSCAVVLTYLQGINIQTKTIVWDADTNGKITAATKNIGVSLNVTNNSPYEVYLEVQGSSPSLNIQPAISFTNNICTTTNQITGARTCIGNTNFYTLSDKLFVGRSSLGIPEDVQAFSSFRINLGSFPITSTVTSLPIDVITTMHYAVFPNSKYTTAIFNLTPTTYESAYIPST